MRLTRNPLAKASLALLLASSGTACRASIDAFGADAARARYAAQTLFAGFAYRFYGVTRDSAFEHARKEMGEYALIPSRLYRDSTIWNDRADSSRTLVVGATFTDNRYLFKANPQTPAPRALGDERHALTLRWLGGGDYEWFTQVDHVIGTAKPAAIGAAIMATLTAAEGRSADEALADARSMFPEAGRHLTQLFSIDSLRTSHEGGATTTSLSVRFRPELLRPRYPYFAGFVSKYIMPTIYSVQLTDHSGRQFFQATGRDGQLTMRVRSRDHRLVSMTGVPVAMPDSLRLTMDVSMKYKAFRIGFRNLVSDFTIERTRNRRAWMMRFQKEPAWQFPLAVDKLIKNPLRRPFAGRGAELSLGVRDDRGTQTISDRYGRVVVNESAIMRWLGRLGASAFGDFSGRTELEENLFLYELFDALRRDVKRES